MVGFDNHMSRRCCKLFFDTSDMRSSCMLKFSLCIFRWYVLNALGSGQFDHYYCALDTLMCLAGINGVGCALLNRKVHA